MRLYANNFVAEFQSTEIVNKNFNHFIFLNYFINMKKTNQFFLLTAAFLLVAFTTMSAQRTTKPSGSTTTTSGSATTTTVSPDADIPAAMRDLCKNWQDAYNAKDLSALGTMYTDNVVLVEPDGTKSTVTREDVIGNLENDIVIGPDIRVIEVNFGSATVLPDGDVRLVGTFVTTTIDAKTGETSRETGVFDNVTTRVADGSYDLKQTSVTRNQ